MGKISSLPRQIRDGLNVRLDDGETESTILPWLNSLPETQELLREKFHSKPISTENLYQYRKRGYHRWQVQQSALEFVASRNEDNSAPATQDLSSQTLIQHLVDYICLRFAAVVQSASNPDDPKTELRDVQSLLTNALALRRGELVSRRIDLEQQRLKHQQLKTDKHLEKLFWEWAKRPDVIAKLAPHRHPDKLRQDVVRLVDQQVLGLRNTFAHDPESNPQVASDPDPACLV